MPVLYALIPIPARHRYLRLKAERPAAYLVQTFVAENLTADRAPSSRMSTQSTPRVRFQVDHGAFGRLIELVLERQKSAPEHSIQGSDDCGSSSSSDRYDPTDVVARYTMGAEEYLSALLWTLELTGNAASSQPRRSFLPSRAPTAEDLALYLNHCAGQSHRSVAQPAANLAEEQQKDTVLSQPVDDSERNMTPIHPYTVGLSTLPLHSAEKLLPVYLSPLVSALRSEAQREVQAKVVANERSADGPLGKRLIAWLRSSWVGAMVGAAASASSNALSSDYVPPEAGSPCVVRYHLPIANLANPTLRDSLFRVVLRRTVSMLRYMLSRKPLTQSACFSTSDSLPL